MFKKIIKISFFTLFIVNIHSKNISYYEDTDVSSQARNYISEYLIHFSDNIDYFITKKEKHRHNKTSLKIELSTEKEKNKSFKAEAKIKLSIRLPNTEKKLKLILINEKDKNRSTDRDENNIALEYKVIDEIRNSLYAKVGFRLKSEIHRYITLKYKLSFLLKENIRTNIIQDFTYSSNEKLVSITSLDFTKYLKYPFYIKNYNEYEWVKDTEIGSIFNALTLYQKIKKKDYYAYEINTTADNENTNTKTKDYNLLFTYRSYIKPWMYYEIVPKLIYSREKEEKNFKASNQINLNFVMHFGQ